MKFALKVLLTVWMVSVGVNAAWASPDAVVGRKGGRLQCWSDDRQWQLVATLSEGWKNMEIVSFELPNSERQEHLIFLNQAANDWPFSPIMNSFGLTDAREGECSHSIAFRLWFAAARFRAKITTDCQYRVVHPLYRSVSHRGGKYSIPMTCELDVR